MSDSGLLRTILGQSRRQGAKGSVQDKDGNNGTYWRDKEDSKLVARPAPTGRATALRV